MLKDKKFNIYFISISIFILTIAIIRSIKMGITCDEALTYLNFVLDSKLKFISFTANNHLLNTYLIKLLTFITNIKYNEFLIRIPSLSFYVIYIIYSYKLSSLYKHKYSIVSILLFNYSINEFASLARGYTMASSIILAGIYYYKKWLLEKENKNLIKSLFLILISSFANTITLIIFGCFTIDAIIRIIKRKQLLDFIKTNKLFIILISIISLFLLVYHIYIFYNDNYISYCTEDFFNCIIYNPIKYYGIEFINPKLLIYFILMLIFFAIINLKYINIEYNFFYMIIILFVLFIILKYILSINFFIGRSLIPFHSIYIICIFELFELFNKNKLINVVLIVITTICGYTFVLKTNTNYVREWIYDSQMKELAKKTYINNKQISIDNFETGQKQALIFYNEKYILLYKYHLIKNQRINS